MVVEGATANNCHSCGIIMSHTKPYKQQRLILVLLALH